MAKLIPLDLVPLHYFEEENSYFGQACEDSFTSVSVCQIAPGKMQAKHFHERPDDGNELLLIYAGKCEVVVNDEVTVHDCAVSGPLLVSYQSLEKGCIRNLDPAAPVKFLNIFSPPFRQGELHIEETPL